MAYTTVTEVRKNTTYAHTVINGQTGLSINLPDNYTISFDSVKRSGVLADPSTYKLHPPNKLIFTDGVGVTSGQYVEIDRKILLTDDEVQEDISTAESMINSKLGRAYTLPFASTPPLVASLSRKLARALIIKRLNKHESYDVHTSELEEAESDIKYCLDYLQRIVDGKDELTDASDAVIARKDNFKETGIIYVGIDDSTEEV